MPAWQQPDPTGNVGVNNANNAADTSLVAGNTEGSLLERTEALLAGQPSVFVPGLGFRVTKTENMNTATGVDLFTVTGKVLITLWTGEVTNAIGTMTDYKLRVKTDNVDLCAATVLSSAAVGYMWSLSNDAGDTLLQSSTGAVSTVKHTDNNAKPMAGRIIGLAGGSCTLQSNRTAADSGDEMKHILFYLPLEASATVAAA
jgi:hypothetical protein